MYTFQHKIRKLHLFVKHLLPWVDILNYSMFSTVERAMGDPPAMGDRPIINWFSKAAFPLEQTCYWRTLVFNDHFSCA